MAQTRPQPERADPREATSDSTPSWHHLEVRDLQGLAREHAKVARKLMHVVQPPVTLGDVLAVDPERFARVPGVGSLYLRYLEQFQAWVRRVGPTMLVGDASEGVETSAEVPATKLQRYTLNELPLTVEERRALQRLRFANQGRLTLQHVLEIDLYQYARRPGVGKVKLAALRSAQRQARKATALLAGDLEVEPGARALVVRADAHEWTLGALDAALVEDTREYLAGLTGRDFEVVRAAIGFEAQRRTLSSLADDFSVSRERTRQVFAKAAASLPWSQRVHPDVLWHNLQRLVDEGVAVEMPALAAVLDGEKGYYMFLAHVCLRDEEEIKARLCVQRPHLNLFDELYATTIGPHTFDDHFNELTLGHRMDADEARACLARLIAQGDLEPGDDALVPRRLLPKVAAASVLLEAHGALTLPEIARRINARGSAALPFKERRGEIYVHTNRWVYLAGKGQFQHVARLRLTRQRIAHVLSLVRERLEAAGGAPRNLHLLFTELEDQLELDYYGVRHVVSRHGLAEGLHFLGHSRVDTVSLHALDAGVTVGMEVMRIVRERHGPITTAELASALPDRDATAIAVHLHSLQESGQLLRCAKASYTLTEQVLAELDTDRLVTLFQARLESAARPVHASRLVEVGEMAFGRDLSSDLVVSLAKLLGRPRGWRVRRQFVSLTPIPYSSNLELLREAAQRAGGARDATLGELQQIVDLTDAAAKRMWTIQAWAL